MSTSQRTRSTAHTYPCLLQHRHIVHHRKRRQDATTPILALTYRQLHGRASQAADSDGRIMHNIMEVQLNMGKSPKAIECFMPHVYFSLAYTYARAEMKLHTSRP